MVLISYHEELIMRSFILLRFYNNLGSDKGLLRKLDLKEDAFLTEVLEA